MPAPNGWSQGLFASLTGFQNIDALLIGSRWAGVVTYSFPTYGSNWSTSPTTGYGATSGNGEPWNAWFSPLSSSDRPFFVSALHKWSSVTNLQVVETADTTSSVGDIRAAYTAGNGATLSLQAWAYPPAASSLAGDIWFNALGTSATSVWTPGSYANFTIIHELGHALGLKHPFSGSPVLSASWDSQIFTVMSYTALAGVPNSTLSFYPTTPMLLDVAALQYLYGANYGWHNGADTYIYGDSTTYNETIWDGGGDDTIRYDGFWASTINLQEAHGSALGNAVYAMTGSFNQSRINNIWIAYGVTIENGIGGSGSDVITGNQVANVLGGRQGNDTLNGLSGNDVLVGGAGNDILDGGTGIDIAVFLGSRSNYVTSRTSSGFTVRDITGTDGTDTLLNVERLLLDSTGVAFDIAGNAGTTAKLLGAVFGRAAVLNPSYVGIGLSYLDGGMSYEGLAQVALTARLGAGFTPVQEVQLLYQNLTGGLAPPGELAYWINALSSGQYTAASLATMASDTAINQLNIDFVGLSVRGLEYQ
jgi:serralysin